MRVQHARRKGIAGADAVDDADDIDLVGLVPTIAQIDARVDAPLVDAPGPAVWPTISASTDAYRHVRATGEWLRDRDTRVQAVTAQGAGQWLLTPLRTDAGFVVLINRGFVPADNKAALPALQSRAEITGLLRVTEPKGGFLRANDPAADRWFSRDVDAIARARGETVPVPASASLFGVG